MQVLHEGVGQSELDEMGITEGTELNRQSSSYAFDHVTANFGPGASAAREELRSLVEEVCTSVVRVSCFDGGVWGGGVRCEVSVTFVGEMYGVPGFVSIWRCCAYLPLRMLRSKSNFGLLSRFIILFSFIYRRVPLGCGEPGSNRSSDGNLRRCRVSNPGLLLRWRLSRETFMRRVKNKG